MESSPLPTTEYSLTMTDILAAAEFLEKYFGM